MKKILSFGLLCLIAITWQGCGKGWLDINDNPNDATSATPDLVLSNALNTTATVFSTRLNQFTSAWMGYWAHSGSWSGFNEEKSYNISNTYYQDIWSGSYDNLNDYNYIQAAAVEQKLPYFEATARIMKAFVFQYLVDTYGNIPYSEALKGDKNLKPKYDADKDVYKALVDELTAAIALIKGGGTSRKPGANSDILFGGDMTSWIKFANTLKLRMLLRQSETGDAAYLTAEAGKIKSEGSGFLDADADVNPGYLNSTGKQNPFWATYGFQVNGATATVGTQYRGGNYIFSILDLYKDPRKSYLFKAAQSDNTFRGIEYGREPGTDIATEKTCGFGPGILKSVSQPVILMLASESKFLQAEAAQRGWLTTDPKTLYLDGIKASFTFLGLPDSTYTKYLNTQTINVSWDDSPNKIEAIIMQKYVANCNTNGIETWCDFRRLGIPKTLPLSVSPSRIGTVQPLRLLYPQTEYQYNPANVGAQNQAANAQFSSKIFWDK